jgi:hypothetical protein
LIFNGMYQFLDDENPLTERYGDVRARVGVFTWAGSFTATRVSVNAGLNYNDVRLGEIQTANYGLLAGAGKPFAKDRLTLNASANFNFARLNGKADGSILNIGLTGNYLAHKKHTLTFGLHWIRSSSTFRGKYAEFRGQIGYAWQLR